VGAMPRGGHNWRGGCTIEGTGAIDVMRLERCGYLAGPQLGSLQWISRNGFTASVLVVGGRETVRLNYKVRSSAEDWQPVSQRIPIRWTPCRFGGERPWFICDVSSNGVYCGRRVAKLYSGGRLFACRHCYRLGYAVQRGGPLDRAHLHLARLHRKLAVNYDGPDGPPPPKPKWMRWKTYSQIVQQIESAQEQLDVVFMAGAQRILAQTERVEHRSRRRRWTRGLRRLR
jgi:hypothetical protein